jgi:hypothetical protein
VRVRSVQRIGAELGSWREGIDDQAAAARKRHATDRSVIRRRTCTVLVILGALVAFEEWVWSLLLAGLFVLPPAYAIIATLDAGVPLRTCRSSLLTRIPERRVGTTTRATPGPQCQLRPWRRTSPSKRGGFHQSNVVSRSGMARLHHTAQDSAASAGPSAARPPRSTASITQRSMSVAPGGRGGPQVDLALG